MSSVYVFGNKSVIVIVQRVIHQDIVGICKKVLRSGWESISRRLHNLLNVVINRLIYY